jgi:lysozyme
MEYNELKERIKEHEGYRNTIYLDSLNKATIGYGHLVTSEDPYKINQEYSKEELDAQFEADFQTAKAHTEKLINGNNVAELLFNAKCVLIEMVFQLGIGGVSKFKKMWSALQKQDYNKASIEMLDSRWAKQTPSRANSLASIMKSCNI